MFRVVEQLFRTALLYNNAAVHDDDGSSDFQRELDFVSYDNHRPAFLRQFLHGVQYVLHQFGIQRGSGFVKQHQLGLNRQCAGDTDALLLTAGKLVGIKVNLVAQADFFQQFQSFFARLGGRFALYGNRTFHYVF